MLTFSSTYLVPLFSLTSTTSSDSLLFPSVTFRSLHSFQPQLVMGYLDDLFAQLQQLQEASNPRFVVDVVTTYFADSEKILNDINGTMDQQPIDFKKVDAYVHKLKGSSSSIGAQRIRNACIAFRSSYVEQNTEACMRCTAQVKQEYAIVKEKLQNLFRLEQQIVEAGGTVPVLHN